MITNKQSIAKSLLQVMALVATATFLFTACKKDSTSTSTAVVPPSNPITSSTISGGFVKGTLLTSVGTYNVNGDLYVKSTDTLFVQPGVTVIVNNNAQVNIAGTLIVAGTQTSPITFTSATGQPGTWGGFQCDSAKYVKIQWAKVIATGGPDSTGSARKTLYVNAADSVIVHDSWFSGGRDDGIRCGSGAKISILRNTIENQGSTDGEAINLKTGVTGDIAYNVIWSSAGSAVKVGTDKTILVPQTNVRIYNNTLVNNGFRRGAAEPGRGILVDVSAIATIFNNLMVNNYYGLDITAKADTIHTTYGNNYFYATIDSVRAFYYPAGDWGKAQSSDIISTSATSYNPLFKTFATTVDPSATTDANDFHLQSGSPAIGKGNSTYNNDIGAYTSDGKGNQH